MARFRIDRSLPLWRKIALSTWRRGDDPTVYGAVHLDATALRRYVARAREATGARVTVTHVIGKAAAVAFARHPDCNAMVSLGRLKLRESVDVFFQVAFDGGRNLAGAKVERADTLSVAQIAARLDDAARRIREKGDSPLQRSQSALRHVPAPLLGRVMRAAEFAMYDLGLDLSRAGIPYDPFGTVMITNVGAFGIEQGFAPLMPLSRVPALLCVGAIRPGVLAVDGAPAVRPVLTIGGTFDHRVIDGAHAGRLSAEVRAILEDPEAHLGAPGGEPPREAGGGGPASE
jgi:pyruvate/2-oxoglutarate dehydrogenase complex dihydrolipoamide acyltransferase (E2) component